MQGGSRRHGFAEISDSESCPLRELQEVRQFVRRLQSMFTSFNLHGKAKEAITSPTLWSAKP